MNLITLAQTTLPVIPPAPEKWTDPSAFGYVVGTLVAAALAVLFAWQYFQSKRMDRQSERIRDTEKNVVDLAKATPPPANVTITAAPERKS